MKGVGLWELNRCRFMGVKQVYVYGVKHERLWDERCRFMGLIVKLYN